MASLTTLILIQLLFCLFFFLYFRYKINQQLNLKEYQQEMDELIIAFNRQAERHISYLESLLENDILKNKAKVDSEGRHPNHQPVGTPHSSSPPSSLKPTEKRSISSTNLNPNYSPSQAIHAFQANLQEPGPTHSSQETLERTSPHPLTLSPVSSKEVQLDLKSQDQARILDLYDRGMTQGAIAKKLLISTAEVNLVLKLKGKK